MQDPMTMVSPLTAAQRLRVYGALGEKSVTITIDSDLLKEAAAGLEIVEEVRASAQVIMAHQARIEARHQREREREDLMDRLSWHYCLISTLVFSAAIAWGIG